MVVLREKRTPLLITHPSGSEYDWGLSSLPDQEPKPFATEASNNQLSVIKYDDAILSRSGGRSRAQLTESKEHKIRRLERKGLIIVDPESLEEPFKDKGPAMYRFRPEENEQVTAREHDRIATSNPDGNSNASPHPELFREGGRRSFRRVQSGRAQGPERGEAKRKTNEPRRTPFSWKIEGLSEAVPNPRSRPQEPPGLKHIPDRLAKKVQRTPLDSILDPYGYGNFPQGLYDSELWNDTPQPILDSLEQRIEQIEAFRSGLSKATAKRDHQADDGGNPSRFEGEPRTTSNATTRKKIWRGAPTRQISAQAVCDGRVGSPICFTVHHHRLRPPPSP